MRVGEIFFWRVWMKNLSNTRKRWYFWQIEIKIWSWGPKNLDSIICLGHKFQYEKKLFLFTALYQIKVITTKVKQLGGGSQIQLNLRIKLLFKYSTMIMELLSIHFLWLERQIITVYLSFSIRTSNISTRKAWSDMNMYLKRFNLFWAFIWKMWKECFCSSWMGVVLMAKIKLKGEWNNNKEIFSICLQMSLLAINQWMPELIKL